MTTDMNDPIGQRLKGEYDAAAVAYQVAVKALSDAVNRDEKDASTMDAITQSLKTAEDAMTELNSRMGE